MIKKLFRSLVAGIVSAALLTSSLPASAQTTYSDRFAGSVVAAIGKQPVDAATTAAITLSGYQTIDGVALTSDRMRVLVKNQSSSTANGIYVVYSGTWIRAQDFSGPSGTVSGQLVYVTGGTQVGLWQLTTVNPVQIDQSGGQASTPSNITFSQISTFASFYGTSTTSNTVGTGAKTFTTQTLLPFLAGQYLIIVDHANSSNYMVGQVTSYNILTGALVMNITATAGSGTKTAWDILISGAPGSTGATGPMGSFAGPEATLSSATTTDLGSTGVQVVSVTGTTTITSFGSTAVIGTPLYFVRFTGALTLTNGANIILPGAANITTAAGDSLVAKYEGSSVWRIISYTKANGQPIASSAVIRVALQTFTANGTYTPCAGILYADSRLWGGGGGGGGVTSTAGNAAAGGGAGAYSRAVFSAATIGASQAVTIGSGGTAGANTGGTGGTGVTTSLGALLTAAGGLGGVGDTAGNGGSLGGAGGAGTDNSVATRGAPGLPSLGGSGVEFSGGGGNTLLGGSGQGKKYTADANGSDALANSGGGGGGAVANGSAHTGGVGGSGFAEITEYCSQ